MSRAQSEKFLYETLDSITGTKDNSKLWRNRLSKMSDATYVKTLKRWIDGKDILHIFVPNGTKININVPKCLALAPKIGFKYFERLHMPATSTDPAYITSVPHMVTVGPIKRQSQSLAKKISTTANDTQVDLLTQQSRGDSDAAAISYPELQLLAQTGLSVTATEFIKNRGGDRGMYAATVAQIEATGSTDMDTTSRYSTGVQSKATLKAYLAAIMIGTTF